MSRNILLTLSCLLAVVFTLLPSHIDAACNLCSDYGIACINETSFNVCYGGVPNTKKGFTCPSQKLCSATSLKCVDVESGGTAACKPNIGCGVCDGGKMFACTSRTTFAQCNGEKLTQNTGECPKGMICHSQGPEMCVDECNKPAVLECDRETPVSA